LLPHFSTAPRADFAVIAGTSIAALQAGWHPALTAWCGVPAAAHGAKLRRIHDQVVRSGSGQAGREHGREPAQIFDHLGDQW
jgi:hypothetical protein